MLLHCSCNQKCELSGREEAGRQGGREGLREEGREGGREGGGLMVHVA